MKKKRGPRIVTIFERIFNFRSWLDFDRMKAFSLYLFEGFKRMFVPQNRPAGNGESFEKAMLEMNLTEEDLKVKQSALFRLSLLMCGAALAFLAYSIYHLFYGGFKAFIISLVLMVIALTLGFRYHFWYFQIKERKLGCTFQEWYRKGLLGEK